SRTKASSTTRTTEGTRPRPRRCRAATGVDRMNVNSVASASGIRTFCAQYREAVTKNTPHSTRAARCALGAEEGVSATRNLKARGNVSVSQTEGKGSEWRAESDELQLGGLK